MLRKIQMNDKDLAFVFIPKAFVELLGLTKGQKVDVRVAEKKIEITPVSACKQVTGVASTAKAMA